MTRMAKILVVDDALSNLHHVAALLDGLHAVQPARSGSQALKMAARQIPDLILLDIDMPEMDGFETLRHFRANNRFSDIPVIFLTGNHDPETEIRGLRSGAVDFITKPFEKSILIHRVDLHLRLAGYQHSLQGMVRDMENNIAVHFAELIECRDSNTGGHIRRTSVFYETLGRALIERGLFEGELDADDLEMMVRAAPLHDIGKVGVSDSVLLKPGKLTDEEFAAIKTHPVVGSSILTTMHERIPTQRYLLYAITIARHHHERYDGRGYPDGLAGGDIPLAARIMSVVDVYDALVSDRVYRKGMTHEEGCAIVREGRGTSFDPDVADVFLEIHDDIRRRAGEIGL